MQVVATIHLTYSPCPHITLSRSVRPPSLPWAKDIKKAEPASAIKIGGVCVLRANGVGLQNDAHSQ
jgi:hypothetical protein